MSLDQLVGLSSPTLADVATRGAGPSGELPLSPDLLLDSPSGDLFGMTQSAGMGWDPSQLLRDQYLILSTMGGIGPRTVHRSRWATTQVTGKSACKCARRRCRIEAA